jgi:hypothetical protein
MQSHVILTIAQGRRHLHSQFVEVELEAYRAVQQLGL